MIELNLFFLVFLLEQRCVESLEDVSCSQSCPGHGCPGSPESRPHPDNYPNNCPSTPRQQAQRTSSLCTREARSTGEHSSHYSSHTPTHRKELILRSLTTTHLPAFGLSQSPGGTDERSSWALSKRRLDHFCHL